MEILSSESAQMTNVSHISSTPFYDAINDKRSFALQASRISMQYIFFFLQITTLKRITRQLINWTVFNSHSFWFLMGLSAKAAIWCSVEESVSELFTAFLNPALPTPSFRSIKVAFPSFICNRMKICKACFDSATVRTLRYSPFKNNCKFNAILAPRLHDCLTLVIFFAFALLFQKQDMKKNWDCSMFSFSWQEAT